MKVLVIHPYRETRHKFYKSHFFMPERPVQVASYLSEQGYDVDFQDFGQTNLDDDHTFSVPAPEELQGAGWNFTRYGWSDSEIEGWLIDHSGEYDAFIVDSLTPYFRDGVELIVNWLDENIKKECTALFGEWVSLRPQDFQDHVAISGNWEDGLHWWLEGLNQDPMLPGVHDFDYSEVAMGDLPPPRWSEFVDMEDYPESFCADYRAGRGCPETCSFCHVAGIYEGSIRGKSAEKIKEDIQYFVDEGFTKLKLRDDNFCVRAPVAHEVFKWVANEHPDLHILQPEGMEMKTAAHVPDVIEQMGRCNYDRVAVGFETAKDGVFQKNNLDWWEEAYQNFKNAGFGPGEITCFVIRGMPGLDRTDEIHTAIYLSQFDVTLLSGGYRLVPGTELWDNWEGEKPYEYGHGLPQDDSEIDEVGKLYRTVSRWNEWGLDLFGDDPLLALADLSWIERVDDHGDAIDVSGTVSGWRRTEGLRYGFAYVLARRGYYRHTMETDTKLKMSIQGHKGQNDFVSKVMDCAEERGIEVQDPPGGLL